MNDPADPSMPNEEYTNSQAPDDGFRAWDPD
jgi:hypothetical protein